MKFWIGVVLFFGIGVGIGNLVARVYIKDGTSVAAAILLGAGAGAFGATFAFMWGHKIYRFVRRGSKN